MDLHYFLRVIPSSLIYLSCSHFHQVSWLFRQPLSVSVNFFLSSTIACPFFQSSSTCNSYHLCFARYPKIICFLFLLSYFPLQSHTSKADSGFCVLPDDKMTNWTWVKRFQYTQGRRRGEKHWITSLTMELVYLKAEEHLRAGYQHTVVGILA